MDLLPAYSVDVESSGSGRRAGKSRARFGDGRSLRYRARCSSVFFADDGAAGGLGSRCSVGRRNNGAGAAFTAVERSLWLVHSCRVRGAARAGGDALAVGSRVLRRRGGRIRGTGFGSSLRSSIGFLSLFLGDESRRACGGCRQS